MEHKGLRPLINPGGIERFDIELRKIPYRFLKGDDGLVERVKIEAVDLGKRGIHAADYRRTLAGENLYVAKDFINALHVKRVYGDVDVVHHMIQRGQ